MTDEEAGTELAEPTATVEVKDGIPVQPPLPKNAYATLPETPVDGNPPVNVAWSVTEAPTMMVAEGLIAVVMIGVALSTVRVSQALEVRLLLPSPLYVALKLYDPAGEGVTELEGRTELPVPTVTVPSEVTVPAQVLPVKRK